MKRFTIYLIAVIIMSCSSNTNQKDNNLENTGDVNEQISNKDEIVNYTIDELFFFQEIDNGDLLATTAGKLSAQSERAMVFVPAGGGEEDAPEFEVKQYNEVHITLSSNNIVTEYHVFNFSSSNDALILKYELENVFQLIKYVAESNSFQEINVADYSLQVDVKNDSVYFEDANILVIGSNKYEFSGKGFEKIN
jgi:hypothetical protein